MSQTMLMTKRLTTFLSQNTSAQLPTLILISPTGKLLSSSSPLPSSKLRTQATIACIIWNLYQPNQTNSSEVISAALTPSSPSGTKGLSTPSISAPLSEHHGAITIQTTDGVMVIRALKCNLLFVAIGSSGISGGSYPSSQTLYSQSQHLSTSSLGSPPGSPSPVHGDTLNPMNVGAREKDGHRDLSGSSTLGSDAGSVGSTTRRANAGIMAIKRQTEDIGKWLEKSLDGFVLGSS